MDISDKEIQQWIIPIVAKLAFKRVGDETIDVAFWEIKMRILNKWIAKNIVISLLVRRRSI